MAHRIPLLLLIALASTLPLTVGCVRAQSSGGDAMDLAWMEGRWTGEADGVRSEELWTSPDGGLLLGLHRDVPGTGRTFFEFLRIEESDTGLVFVAQPLGRPPVRFAASRVASNEVVFENSEHDFPQRIVYSRSGDLLQARVEGTVDGRNRVQSWEWRRQ